MAFNGGLIGSKLRFNGGLIGFNGCYLVRCNIYPLIMSK